MALAVPIMAATAVLSAGYQVHAGEQANRQQKRALRKQAEVQAQSLAAARAEQRRNDEELVRANRRRPEVGTLLTNELEAGSQGVGTTLLTGAGGVDQKRLKLGRSTLLGA